MDKGQRTKLHLQPLDSLLFQYLDNLNYAQDTLSTVNHMQMESK